VFDADRQTLIHKAINVWSVTFSNSAIDSMLRPLSTFIWEPDSLRPGFARLGIIRVHISAGTEPGNAEIEAKLNGGTRYSIQVIVERWASR
jgi:hypothetical protein